MSSGPSREAEAPPPQEPELPGEFVSEELRSDCARFLKELRALVGLRSALPPESAAWVPARARDRARPGCDRRRPAGYRCSASPELPLRAVRAIGHDLRRLVIGEVRAPALLVGRQPAGVALDAARDQGDALGAHAQQSRRRVFRF